MTSPTPDLAAVVARLEKVERQNRRLKTAGIAVLVLAAAGLLMGQAMPKARTVEAEGFVLKDERGEVRAKLAMDKGRPMLALSDEHGMPRVGLLVDKDGPMLGMGDEYGMPRVELSVSKEGPRLILADDNGKTIWRQP